MDIVHIIAGPTACGKSDYALSKAASVNGVIVNADSVQLYDSMPVLTARPTDEDLNKAPHELYGILHPSESCSAEKWRSLATKAITHTLNNGQTPILVGGTGFYIKAILEGFSPIPDIPYSERELATQIQQDLGNPLFYKTLSLKDPDIINKIHANDTHRLIRAWAVFEYTGKSITYWQQLPLSGPPKGLTFTIDIILPDRPLLYTRINSRFNIMLNHGALEEVRELSDMIESGDVPEDAEIIKAHGFRPLRNYLNKLCSLEEATRVTTAQTRQYAKRQMTWLRHQIKEGEPIQDINIISGP